MDSFDKQFTEARDYIFQTYGEQVPDRVTHGKGAGALGYFEVTHDVTEFTQAAFLSEIGKRTDVAARFSTVIGERGSGDDVRDYRGISLKFYTEEGNYDAVLLSIPVFFVRKPELFPPMIKARSRDIASGARMMSLVSEFNALYPETLHAATVLSGSLGIPASYRHINAYGNHTFQWINEKGKAVWIKIHFLTDTPQEEFTRIMAMKALGRDPDRSMKDLYNFIKKKENKLVWNMHVQIMPLEEAHSYRFHPFHLNKVWFKEDYPLIPVGKLVLERNPEHFISDIEKLAFSPGNFVRGIGPGPDPMMDFRMDAYPMANLVRLGKGYEAFEGNRPQGVIKGKAIPNWKDVVVPYEFNIPEEDPRCNDYIQPGEIFRKFGNVEQMYIIESLAEDYKSLEPKYQHLIIQQCYRADIDYGQMMAEELEVSIDDVHL